MFLPNKYSTVEKNFPSGQKSQSEVKSIKSSIEDDTQQPAKTDLDLEQPQHGAADVEGPVPPLALGFLHSTATFVIQ